MSYIINTAKEIVTKYKKHEVSGKLMDREWRMLTDDSSISGKYIFLKDGKLLLSVNGLSTYSTWQMATESTLIMDEGVATFLYKVEHIDEHIVVLILDGTGNFCFLTNVASQTLQNPTLEDIRWYLYRSCAIDILSNEQKQVLKLEEEKKEEQNRREMENFQKEQEEEDWIITKALIIVFSIIFALLGAFIAFGR